MRFYSQIFRNHIRPLGLSYLRKHFIGDVHILRIMENMEEEEEETKGTAILFIYAS